MEVYAQRKLNNVNIKGSQTNLYLKTPKTTPTAHMVLALLFLLAQKCGENPLSFIPKSGVTCHLVVGGGDGDGSGWGGARGGASSPLRHTS